MTAKTLTLGVIALVAWGLAALAITYISDNRRYSFALQKHQMQTSDPQVVKYIVPGAYSDCKGRIYDELASRGGTLWHEVDEGSLWIVSRGVAPDEVVTVIAHSSEHPAPNASEQFAVIVERKEWRGLQELQSIFQ